MAKLLDFENQEKGFKPFSCTNENVKLNIGKRICYVDFVEPHRGTYFVRHGIIHSIRRNQLFLNDGHSSVDIRRIKEAGIKIDAEQTPETT